MLRAGTARTKITPSVEVDLSGYGFREGPSTGVHDDLWCRALVLDDGESRLALLAFDLLGVDFFLDSALRKAVAAAVSVPEDHVLINCSHTHAAPVVAGLVRMGDCNEEYMSALPEWAGEAAAAAAAGLAPARLSYGQQGARIGINRRERNEDGSISLGRNPEGLADDFVRALKVEREGGLAALVFHHACHGTTMKGVNRMISAEWMGAACERLSERLGGEVIPIFLQGCCGQINPDSRERSFEEVNRLGAKAAEAALAAAAKAEPLRGGGLAAQRRTIRLPLQDPPAPEAARARLARAERELEQAREQGAHPYVVRAHEALVSHTRKVLDWAEAGARDQKLPFAIQAMRIGEMGIVGLSGEVFLEFAHQIEAGSPFRHTLVLGYSNGCTGYVPTAEAFQEGGYEAEDSFRWYGTLPLAPEAGEVMVGAAQRALKEVRRRSVSR